MKAKVTHVDENGITHHKQEKPVVIIDLEQLNLGVFMHACRWVFVCAKFAQRMGWIFDQFSRKFYLAGKGTVTATFIWLDVDNQALHIELENPITYCSVGITL